MQRVLTVARPPAIVGGLALVAAVALFLLVSKTGSAACNVPLPSGANGASAATVENRAASPVRVGRAVRDSSMTMVAVCGRHHVALYEGEVKLPAGGGMLYDTDGGDVQYGIFPATSATEIQVVDEHGSDAALLRFPPTGEHQCPIPSRPPITVVACDSLVVVEWNVGQHDVVPSGVVQGMALDPHAEPAELGFFLWGVQERGNDTVVLFGFWKPSKTRVDLAIDVSSREDASVAMMTATLEWGN